jgi:ketosteroid isomerase-like protein
LQKEDAMRKIVSSEEMTDRISIRELVDTYAQCADTQDAKGQMALFTDDTVFVVFMDSKASEPSYVLNGRDALAPVFDNLNSYHTTTHFNGQSIISIQGERATGETGASSHRTGGKRTLMIASIRYHDTFAKIDGIWRFAQRILLVDWTDTRSSIN